MYKTAFDCYFKQIGHKLLKLWFTNKTSHMVVLLPATVQDLVFALLHVSATYCSHIQGAVML